MTLREWQQIPKEKSELIVQASSEKCDDGLTQSSIGMWFKFVLCDDFITKFSNTEHTNLVLNSFTVSTDDFRRGGQSVNRRSIVRTLEKNNIPFQENNDYLAYYQNLPTYKFVISPEGNGIDCHRHYESLMAGCIPVVEEREFIKEKYGNCPILYTKDYAEITPEYLESKYQEMLDIDYNFSKLFLSQWGKTEQDNIRLRGNFWTNRLLGVSWYK